MTIKLSNGIIIIHGRERHLKLIPFLKNNERKILFVSVSLYGLHTHTHIWLVGCLLIINSLEKSKKTFEIWLVIFPL